MKLRTFILSVAATLIVAVCALFLTQAGQVFDRALGEMEAQHQRTVAHTVQSLLQARLFQLETFQQALTRNHDFSSEMVLAAQNKAQRARRLAKWVQLQKQWKLDELQVYLNGEPLFPGTSDLCSTVGCTETKSPFALLAGTAERKLVAVSPLSHYGERIGWLVLSFSLDKTLALDVKQASQVEVAFSSENGAVPLPTIPGLSNPTALGIRMPPSSLWLAGMNTRTTVTFWGLACLLLVTVFLYLLLELGFVRRFQTILAEIRRYTAALTQGSDLPRVSFQRQPIREVDDLSFAFSKLTHSIAGYQSALQQEAHQKAKAQVAEQVAHDLKSPLSALEMILLMETEKGVSENRSGRLSQIAVRIREIIDSLSHPATESRDGILIVPVVRSLISEKRIQFRSRSGLRFRFHASPEATFALCRAHLPTLRRALSNLLDNAVEAMGSNGQVGVRVTTSGDRVAIAIEDTGQGIAPELLPRLGERGLTAGKAHGTGLGLWFAKETVTRLGGTLELKSTLGEGTTVCVQLPRAEAPTWLAQDICLNPDQTVVIVDDDPGVHDAWEAQLHKAGIYSQTERLHFLDPAELVHWWHEKQPDPAHYLFLIDQDFSGTKTTGLELIHELDLKQHAILVTGGDLTVLRQNPTCENVRLLPKDLLSGILLRQAQSPKPVAGKTFFGFLALLLVVLCAPLRAQYPQEALLVEATEAVSPAALSATRLQLEISGLSGDASEDLRTLLLSTLQRHFKRQHVNLRSEGTNPLLTLSGLAPGESRILTGTEAEHFFSRWLWVRVDFSHQGAEFDTVTVTYRWIENGPLQPSRSWSTRAGALETKTFSIHSLAQGRDQIIPYLQKNLRTLPSATPSGLPAPTRLVITRRFHNSEASRWRLLFGLSAGTPTWGNLHVGVRAEFEIPLFAGIAGMHYGNRQRGLEADIGATIYRTRSMEHQLAASATWFNESHDETTRVEDPITRVIRTESVRVDTLQLYLGPSYFLHFGKFRAQTGVGFRTSNEAASSVRLLFQLAFFP